VIRRGGRAAALIVLGAALLLPACRRKPAAPPLSEAASKCESLLTLICEREADCVRKKEPTSDRAVLINDCRAVFDCAQTQQMSGPIETCRADITAASCDMITNHDRSLVAFLLSAESPLSSCNKVVVRSGER
jgi:hypothetical protein